MCLWLMLFIALSQNAQAQFAKNFDAFFGGEGYDEIQKIIEVSDGYIFGGTASYSAIGDPPVTYGLSDYWLFKTDFDGNLLWSEVYGGTSTDILLDVIMTSDGGYMLAGFSFSDNDGIKSTPSFGDKDMWIIKLDAARNIEWDMAYGGGAEDHLSAIRQVSDGGFVFGGWTSSLVSGDVSEPSRGGEHDMWLLRVNANGGLLWEKRIGGNDNDLMQSMILDQNEDILIAGLSKSGVSGEKSEPSFGNQDYWVVKLNIAGGIIWDRSYGGIWVDQAQVIKQAPDGRIFVGGYSESPVGGNKTSPNNGGSDYWLISIDEDGNKIVDESYGGGNNDVMRDLDILPKGQLVIGGQSKSDAGGDKSENSYGDFDYWTIVLDDNYDVFWDQTFGASAIDNFQTVVRLSNGDLMAGGFSLSLNGGNINDVSNGVQDGLIAVFECTLSDFLELGLDTIVCQYEPIELDASVGLDYVCEYLWSDGYTEPTRTVIADGPQTYSVTVTDLYGCMAEDDFTIETLPAPEFDLGDPIIGLCVGDTAYLVAEVEGSGLVYEWNTGENGNSLEITSEGIYQLTVTNSIGCTFADTVEVIDFLLPSFDLGEDQLICEGDTVTFSVAHLGPDYMWSTGEEDFFIQATEAGEYSVTVTDLNGCSNSDSAELIYFDELPAYLGEDTTICLNEDFSFNASIPGCMNCEYVWEDDSTGPIRIVSPQENTLYGITITDDNGCITSDEINIDVHPLPEVSLSANDEICEGESIELSFILTGVGPFDVVYEVNGDIQILLDIQSGHTITLSPTMTTVYRVSSVTDGSIYECINTESEELAVLVNDVFEFEDFTEICEGDSIFLEGVYQYDDGIFVDSFLSVNGCDSVVITDLTVNETSLDMRQETTCIESEVRHDTIYFANQFGCDSLVITHIDLLESSFEEFFETSCDVDENISDTTTYVNQFGCDSVIVINTIPLPNDILDLNDTTCDEEMAGPDTLFFTNQYGCDSLIITDFLYIQPDTIREAEGSCFVEDVGIDTSWYANQYGCDSVVIITTTLLPSDTLVNNLITCVSSEVGSDTSYFVNQYGCESLIISNFILALSDTVNVSMPDCDPANVGIDTTIYSNSTGCDSMVVVTTFLLEPDTIMTGAITCDIDHVEIDTISYLDNMGCDSVVITNYTYLPPMTVNIEEFTCDIDQIDPDTFFLSNQFGCDSTVIVMYEYVEPDTTYALGTTCDTALVGIQELVLTNVIGCDSIILTDNTLLPRDTVVVEFYLCDEASFSDTTFLINQYGCDSLIIENYTEVTGSLEFFDDTTCDPMETGMVTEIFLNQYGCDSIVVTDYSLIEGDTIDLFEFVCSPSQVGTDTLVYPGMLCDSFVVTHFEYLPPDSTFFDFVSCNPEDTGVTVDYLSNAFGCDSLIITTVTFAEMDSTSTYEYSCLTLDTLLNLITLENQFGCDSIIYEYTIPGFDTVNNVVYTCDPALVQVDTLVFIDENGCDSLVIEGYELSPAFETFFVIATCDMDQVNSDTVFLRTDEGCDSLLIYNTILDVPSLNLETFDPPCSDDNGGVIEVIIDGGTPPYQVSLDGQLFGLQNVFTELMSGTYEIGIEDDNGCQDFMTVVLEQDEGITVDVEQIFTIEYGDFVDIQPIINGVADTFYWQGLDSLVCEDCLNQYFAPTESMTLNFTAIDEEGCKDFRQIIVVVEKNYNVYVPSGFSPNGDGLNDYFTVYATDNVKEIRAFQLFDRWGEELFYQEILDINVETDGWDGVFKGKNMHPGVYLYQFEVEFFDGYTEFRKGDFTLVR